MLQLANTRFGHSFHRDVATGNVVDVEGSALAYVMEGGKAKVRKSTGAAGERFAGFSLSRNTQQSRLTEIVTVRVPATAPYTVELKHEPIANQIRVAGLTIAAEAAEGKVKQAGKVLTFDASAAGQSFEVALAFVPTVLEANARLGQAPVGGLAAVAMNVVGVIDEGDVFTDQYDVTADWVGDGVNPPNIYLGADGLLTTKSGGTKLNSVTLIQVPSAGSPFVGVTVRRS